MRIFWQSYVDDVTGVDYWSHLRPHLDSAALSGTTVEVFGISPPNAYAHPLVEMRCARQMIANAVRAEEEGYDAFVVGHFQDAGLAEARAAVDIPVIGLGEATLLHACTLGAQIGVVTINPRFIAWIRRQVLAYGLSQRVVAVRAMVFEPGQIMAAFADSAAYASAQAQFRAEAAPLVAEGCDVLVSGGGIPMLLFGREPGFRVGDVPVLDGLPVALMAAETAVRLKRQHGVSLSRTGDYAKAPPEVIAEFIGQPSRA